MSVLAVMLLILLSLLIFEGLLRFLVKRTGRDLTPTFCPLNQPKIRNLIQPIQTCLELSHIEPGLTVLALGTKDGEQIASVLKHLGRDGVFVGIDRSITHISACEAYLEKHSDPGTSASWEIYRVRDEGDLPFPPESFDVILLLNSFDSLEDSSRFLIESFRVLKQGGIISVSDYLPSRFYNLPQIPRNKLEHAGFSSLFFSGTILAYTLIARKEQSITQQSRM